MISLSKKDRLFLYTMSFFTIATLIFITFFIPRFPQWLGYHQFADQRTLWGIPNFGNVVSNIFFIWVSLIGFIKLFNAREHTDITWQETTIFTVAFIGTFLVGLGSTYYHYHPDNACLVWDRIPIVVIYMALVALTLTTRIHVNLGFLLLPLLLILGNSSVLYWYWTELLGRGDLRWYGVVQYYFFFLIMFILFAYPKDWPSTKCYLWILFFYTVFKLCEFFDAAIFNMGHIVSGHTLKHITAAIAVYGLVLMLNEKHSLALNTQSQNALIN